MSKFLADYVQRQINGIRRSSHDNPASVGALQAFENVQRFLAEQAGGEEAETAEDTLDEARRLFTRIHSGFQPPEIVAGETVELARLLDVGADLIEALAAR